MTLRNIRNLLTNCIFKAVNVREGVSKNLSFQIPPAIQERVMAVLRSIPKEAFADSFQKLYERCQQCVVKNGDYFEGQ
jgi:hypothetical protein